MKNNEENKLNEVWEKPMLTALNVNKDTKNGVGDTSDFDDGNTYS
ncbi:MAG: hypothetical protein H6Q17_7 [Bacteroidetes bacterium]|nr:hypothetical protein [Bacteroidota bacterium]